MGAGKQWGQALNSEFPLQIVGTINAYVALMAKQLGFRAIYLSGAGVANDSYGLPDLGLTTLDNVCEDIRRITAAVDLPLLVDIDTGFGGPLMVERTVCSVAKAGAAAIHMEDQVAQKRCGHRPGKELVSKEEMVERLLAAYEACPDCDFYMIARTDALAVEGVEMTIERCQAYRDAGADAIFLEAARTLEDYRIIKREVGLPILANITEFGMTPLFTLGELQVAGVDMALYPLSATRAMHHAARRVLEELRSNGTQRCSLQHMQTREELYRFLNYYAYEERLNRLQSRAKEKSDESGSV